MVEIAPGVHVPSGAQRLCTWRKCEFKCPADDQDAFAAHLSETHHWPEFAADELAHIRHDIVKARLAMADVHGQFDGRTRDLTKSEVGALDLVVLSLFHTIEQLDPTALDHLGFPARPRPTESKETYSPQSNLGTTHSKRE